MSPRIPTTVRDRVRAQARDRCGYCLSTQRLVLGPLEIEHMIPTARGGTDDEENLWLACRLCDGFKGVQTHGVDPLTGRRMKLFTPPPTTLDEALPMDCRRDRHRGSHSVWACDGISAPIEQLARTIGSKRLGRGWVASTARLKPDVLPEAMNEDSRPSAPLE